MPSRSKSAKQTFDPRKVKENIVETPLNEEMSKSFLEYAYSVIYARALPDARDGMKPVQRRIVYQMGNMNLTPEHAYMKSARVVGEVMGKLHPHGDSAIYEAMVRLAQPFSLRLPLVDGHGNFGSLDDGPAASRYTEARLAPAALGMNADINEDTVDFAPNYDNKLKEPTVLPSAIPNLLVNGASGIAVGMATNMATHNLGEVVAAAKYVMKHPNATLDDLMQIVPGPDWPGGGIIIGRNGIREAYETGRGAFTTRSKTHIENVTARKKAIIVTELPFMVGPERVLERISQGIKARKLDGISGAIDLTDRHNGTRIVIEIKTGFDPNAVLAQLFKHTPLQESFTINNVALVDGRPHTMGLRELLDVWILHRRTVIRRRSEFRLNKAKERLHLVEGLLLAMLDIDEVIQVIRSSEDAETAKSKLISVFDLDEIQAQYILDLRLRRLTKMSRIELEGEKNDLLQKIDELNEILSSANQLDKVVIAEMDYAVKQWDTPRRTILLDEQEDGSFTPVCTKNSKEVNSDSAMDAVIAANQLTNAQADVAAAASAARKSGDIDATSAALQLSDEPCAVALSTSGLIARTSVETFNRWQAHSSNIFDTPCLSMFTTTTLATYALITSAGRLVIAHVADLPHLNQGNEDVLESLSNGVKASELLTSTQSTDPIRGEKVVAAIALSGSDSKTPLAIGTKNGVVKRWNFESPTTMDSWSIIDLKDNDSVINAALANDEDRLVFISSDSSLLTFDAKQVRAQGRSSAGMAGIRLNQGCTVSAFAVVAKNDVEWNYEEGENGLFSASGSVVFTLAGDSDALAGTENGAAKITPLEMYPTKGRGTGGVRSQRFLKGQNTILAAYVGNYPLYATTQRGANVELPKPDMRRDASGTELVSPIAHIG
ncbi:DNA gyrase/topoisomerase IV subunit A [Gardnerella vaginalis]|uniref:DNA topoisomerase (ATP-hydrolyzing) n=1 Tax=Gardnerella vaginalis JCP8108 TaxID=1261066 RepID=S4GIM8_GARVA|nr:DNA topoisomerase IV subunit A [Gardnerella vaginalis]EPI49058.1 DNA gyrase/topoisomerase IV, A subunit [Gardnerella vaginalis JCP8108]